MSSVALVHIGKHIPQHLYDCLYQILLINGHSCKIWIVLSDNLVDEFMNQVKHFNFDPILPRFYFLTCIQIVPLSILETENGSNSKIQRYKQAVMTKDNNHDLTEFRDGFWISTTCRFFYLEALCKRFNINGLFHIENDIMMYESFEEIRKNVGEKISMVQDSPNRVIPSILFFPNCDALSHLTTFICEWTERNDHFTNDMNILGAYPNEHKSKLPFDATKIAKNGLIFDGASIGQYLGGVDVLNFSGTEIQQYSNPTKGFVNETCLFKPNTCTFYRQSVQCDNYAIPYKIFTCMPGLLQVANLHIHSKELYQFSSVFDIPFDEIITGDRIVSMCDFVILTKSILRSHKGLEHFAKDTILIKDFPTANVDLLNEYFKSTSKTCIKIFLYTHILQPFVDHILNKLDSSLSYVMYLHNSEVNFRSNSCFDKLLEKDYVKHVYCQNMDYPSNHINVNKLTPLPAGISNSMTPHGDLVQLYRTMKNTYKYKKTKGLYVSNQHQHVVQMLHPPQSLTKSYEEHLEQLASHRFCLCLRTNESLDTHQFWEALYLGVIPVVIDDQFLESHHFLESLKNLNLPFVSIKSMEDVVKKLTEGYFDECLYNKLVKICNCSIHNIPALKLSYYSYIE